MNFIKLTQFDARASRSRQSLDDEVSTSGDIPMRAVHVNPATISRMTDRREGVGTRITFVDGGGFSVSEALSAIEDESGLRFVTLTQLDVRASRNASHQEEDLGEDDQMDQGRPSIPTRPVKVNPATISRMTDRRGEDGTRITFADGGGFSVVETMGVVEGMINPN